MKLSREWATAIRPDSAPDECERESAVYAAGNLNPIAELEPTQYIFTDQDPTNPTDTRFLHVLQGADAGASMVPATYLQSTSGTAFDGAAFGTSVIYFPVSATAAFTGTTLPAPIGTTTMLVTGFMPGATYSTSVAMAGTQNLVTISPSNSGSKADSAGVLMLTF